MKIELGYAPLAGRFVRLEPFTSVRDEIRDAFNCDAESWSLLLTSGQGDHFDGWWDRTTAASRNGERMPYCHPLAS